ncbi:hypothetical protein VFPBJ_00117 [Purpureocillium lilacinum]|uniref:Uncharacterized protein n=1 Tax=Purpureocillium lilacinum TaxID=33203 RepID=A0A179H7C7_PURLI|nr:hypothetical protein VFPBJ_00117 [Purpureocillium lilacinum]
MGVAHAWRLCKGSRCALVWTTVRYLGCKKSWDSGAEAASPYLGWGGGNGKTRHTEAGVDGSHIVLATEGLVCLHTVAAFRRRIQARLETGIKNSSEAVMDGWSVQV